MNNIFNNPKSYLDELITKEIFPKEMIAKTKLEYSGKSMLCAWITKLCPLECDKCFFKSNMNHDNLITEEYQLTNLGIKKLIEFVNASNSGYLMLSGGGDPMMCLESVSEIIKKTITNRIVIVTSGFWAKRYLDAKNIIDKLYNAYTSRILNEEITIVIRLSVDEFHAKPLNGYDHFKNVISVFKNDYKNEKNFILMIHTIKDDTTLNNIANGMGADISFGENGESDNPHVIKIVPKKAIMTFNDGYKINIGVSKLFYSDLMVNLCNHESDQVKEAVKVMTDDIENSEQDNPAYIQNSLGKKGLDFWLDYNGNITTWFNQDWDSIYNIYTQSYDEIVEKTFSNPTSARFLKKGYENRNSIITEVNPLAVLRAKAINLRDYVAAFLLEEDKTKLYYSIRGLREYCTEFALKDSDFCDLSEELREAILVLSQEDLISQYRKSKYDILDQYLDEKKFKKEVWEDILLLVALNHYEVDKERLEKKINFYNEITGKKKSNIKDFLIDYNDEIYIRLHKRISFMQKEAYNILNEGND